MDQGDHSEQSEYSELSELAEATNPAFTSSTSSEAESEEIYQRDPALDILPRGRQLRVNLIQIYGAFTIDAYVKESDIRDGSITLLTDGPLVYTEPEDEAIRSSEVIKINKTDMIRTIVLNTQYIAPMPEEPRIKGANEYKLYGMRGIKYLSIISRRLGMSEVAFIQKETEREELSFDAEENEDTEGTRNYIKKKSTLNADVQEITLKEITYQNLHDDEIMPVGKIIWVKIREDSREYVVHAVVESTNAGYGEVVLKCNQAYGPSSFGDRLSSPRPWLYKLDGMRGVRRLWIMWTKIGAQIIYVDRLTNRENCFLRGGQQGAREMTKDYIRSKTLTNKNVTYITLERKL